MIAIFRRRRETP